MRSIETRACQVNGTSARKVIVDQWPLLDCYEPQTISYREYLKRELGMDLRYGTMKGRPIPDSIARDPRHAIALAAFSAISFICTLCLPLFL
ncbi:MAG: hypothetical protein IJJ14_02020 [Coriobacteriales bacterium]|nr:hypothetical protein [Coriobacteriales bacterium]MBQ6586753.1 hypothetical protein [Coriobacteriales bacterium]